MALPEAKYKITAQDATKDAAASALRNLKGLDSSVKTLAGNFRNIFAGAGIGLILGGIVKNTVEAEKAFAKLDNAVKTNAGSANVTTAELAAMASQLQKVTTYSDEAVMEMQGLLLRFKEIGGAENKRAQMAILDLATALGKDLPSATQLVGRALANPEKGMIQLGRAGVVLSAEQQKLIKTLNETGHASQAQALLLSELEKRYGGAAVAVRNTFGGAIEGLKNAVSDLMEAKGGLPGLTSEINKLADSLSSPAAKESADTFGSALITTIMGIGHVAAVALDPVAKFLLKANDLGALLDKKVNGEALSEAEFTRIYGMAPRSNSGPSRRHAVAPAPTEAYISQGSPAYLEAVHPTALRSKEYQAELAASKELRSGIEDLQDAYDTREALFKLSEAGIQDGLDDSSDKIKESIKQIADVSVETSNTMSEFAKSAAQNMQSHFADFLFDPFDGGVKGMLKGFIDVIRRMAAEAAAASIFNSLFGATSKDGSNGLVSFLGGMFGGMKASGGSVSSGKGYVVGEQGPEFFMPGSSGSIVPNGALAGSPPINITTHIDARGAGPDLISSLPGILRKNNEAVKADIIEGLRRKRYAGV